MSKRNVRVFDNTLGPGQDGRHFADAIFLLILLYEMYFIRIEIS